MKAKLFALIAIILIVPGCGYIADTISEKIPCETCTEKIADYMECRSVCEERFEAANGTTILGKKVTALDSFKKNIQISTEEGEKVSCVCFYGFE